MPIFNEAWGVETYDEPVITYAVPPIKDESQNPPVLRLNSLEYYPTFFYSETDVSTTNYGTSVTADGMTNTKKYFPTNTKWGDFLNLKQVTDVKNNDVVFVLPENDNPFLKKGERTLKNSVLLRNRDSNGNGVIDEGEIKWYIADRKQITSFAMCDVGIDGDAKLFTIENQFDFLQKKMWGNPVLAKFGISTSNASTAI